MAAPSIGDIKVPQCVSLSPPAYADRFTTPDPNSLWGFDASGFPAAVEVGTGLALVGNVLEATIGIGTVTSVALALPSSIFDISGSPVTSNGTLTGSFKTQIANKVFAGPVSGGDAVPAFRALVAADIPALPYQPTGTYVTAVTGTSPISSSGGTTPAISILQSGAATDGYLSSTDWNAFNDKQPAGSYLTAVTADSPLSGAGTSASHLVIAQATAIADGYLSSTDWSTFNSKQAAGSYITALTGDVTASGPGSVAATLANTTVTPGSYTLASITVDSKGRITSASNGTAGTVTSISIASSNGFAGSSSGGATPALTLSTTVTGIIKGNGTALSAASAGTDYSAGTSALATGILKSTTATGALTIAVAGDFPTLNQNTTGSAATLTTARTINGVSFNGSANITVPSDIAPGSSGNVLTSNGTTWTSAAAAGGTGADPTASIGLTTVNGSATTYMRSDAAPALDQGIAPTWTGQHRFQYGIATAPMLFGADDGATTLTNATSKAVRIGAPHYANAQEPVFLIGAVNSITENKIFIGGSNSNFNAATEINFYAAGTSTTITGSLVASLNLQGLILPNLTAGRVAIAGTGGLVTTDAGLTYNSTTDILSAAGFTSTVSTGTAPLTVASTTVVGNLNVSQLLGGTWAVPGTIGSTTPNSGVFTTLQAATEVLLNNATNPAPDAGILLHIVPADGADAGIQGTSAGNRGLTLIGRRSEGTMASPAATGLSVPIILMTAEGYANGAYTTAAATMQIRSLNAWTSTDHSTQFIVTLCPSGSTTLTNALVVRPGAIQFSGYGAGTLTTDGSGNITAVSDERVKTNIRPFTAGLTELLGLNPILHGYTLESGLDQSRDDYAGFSAQNVQAHIPQAVAMAPDGKLSLSDRPILAAVVNAVKTHHDEITHLKARLAYLEGQMAA